MKGAAAVAVIGGAAYAANAFAKSAKNAAEGAVEDSIEEAQRRGAAAANVGIIAAEDAAETAVILPGVIAKDAGKGVARSVKGATRTVTDAASDVIGSASSAASGLIRWWNNPNRV